jgi:hypothetical protein
MSTDEMYKHTQIGWIIWIICIPVIMGIWILAIVHPMPEMTSAVFVAVVILIALSIFGRLTVYGDNQQFGFYYGFGVIKKQFSYAEVKSIKKARNHWFWGWGIRWFGRGWLYNVSGLDAIEVQLKTGRVLRIGTDEPDTLYRFLLPKIG